MNADNNSKAVVVYVPQQTKKLFHIRAFLKRLDTFLLKYFHRNRNLLISFLIVFSLFFLAGNCVAAHYLYKLPYILDVFIDKYFIKTFLIAYFIVFASGYTIFGSVLSVCFFALISFLFGNLIYCSFAIIQFDFQHIILLAVSLTNAFLLSLFCCEAFRYYPHCNDKKQIIFSKSSVIYLSVYITTLIISFILSALIIY